MPILPRHAKEGKAVGSTIAMSLVDGKLKTAGDQELLVDTLDDLPTRLFWAAACLVPSRLNPEDPNRVLLVKDSLSYRCLVEQS